MPIIKTTSGTDTSYTGCSVSSTTFRGNRGGVTYNAESFRIDGCAGYASARARFTIAVETDRSGRPDRPVGPAVSASADKTDCLTVRCGLPLTSLGSCMSTAQPLAS